MHHLALAGVGVWGVVALYLCIPSACQCVSLGE